MSVSEPVQVDVVIVGAGVSGICMAAHLDRIGASYVVIERLRGFGGTWRANTYPGAACDTQSHHYSFSFALNPNWSRVFSPQAEILEYLESTAHSLGIHEKTRFGVTVTGASWDELAGRWGVECSDGSLFSSRALVSAVGQLNEPNIPEFPGLDEFDQPNFHTAEWDHDQPLDGLRVGVVGNAASGLQLIPPVAERAAHLTVFQRSPNHVFPRDDRSYTDEERRKFARSKLAARWHRYRIYWEWERWWPAFLKGSKAAKARQAENQAWIRDQVSDPEFADVLTPTYEVGCKRVLLADDYYPALQRDNVEVVTTPIERLTGGAVVAGGREIDLDVLVFATGFKARDFLASMDILGRRGSRLHEAWGDAPTAHLGITVPGFPNFFMLYGPNTNLGHNSIIFMIECQANYIVRCLARIEERRLRYLDLAPAAMRAFNRKMHADLAETAWAKIPHSWYKTDAGKITNNWSGTTTRYWWETRRPKFDDYRQVER